MTDWVDDPDDNSTVGASGGYFPPDTRTEEEKQREREELAAISRRINEERAANLETDLRLLASSNPAIQAVARLHGPKTTAYYRDPVCEGCDGEGYDCEPPEWPCRTWNLVAMMQREADGLPTTEETT